MTTTSINPYIQEITWQEARLLFKDTEPELVEIIDAIDPDNLTFIKISYLYGDEFYSDITYRVPLADRSLVSLNDPAVPSKLKKALGYNVLPIGFSCGKGIEVFSELDKNIFSLAYFHEGLHIGIWETFAPPIRVNITAGARSLNMLPRITETNSHKRLKRLGVETPPPKNSFDQWYVFKEAAKHSLFKPTWESQQIFFTSEWMDKIKNDKAWVTLYDFLLKKAWKHTEHIRNSMHLKTIWESFTLFLGAKKIKPQPYIVETLQHLVSIATGSLPGYRPATDNIPGPVDRIIHMYMEDYGLKQYYPSLLQPDFFSLNKKDPYNFIYYSLQVPSYLGSIPKTRSPVSVRSDLIELIELINQFSTELMDNKYLQIGAQHVYDLLIKVKFDYFHDEPEPHMNIMHTSQIPLADPRFLYLPADMKNKEPLKFCDRGSFVRGCVRISKRD